MTETPMERLIQSLRVTAKTGQYPLPPTEQPGYMFAGRPVVIDSATLEDAANQLSALSSRAPQAGGEGLAAALVAVTNQDAFLDMPKYVRDMANRALDEAAALVTPADAPKGDVRVPPPGFEVHPLDWIKFLVESNPFPQGMTGEQWKRVSAEIIGTIDLASTPSQDEKEALRSALFLANRDKESILRRLDTDIAGVEARPKSGEINETLRDGALGALRAFRAAIVEGEWTAPREHLTVTQKLENIEDAIVDSILAEPAGAEGEALRRALEDIALLDEADGHELTVKHAFRAVAIATSILGKHPSEICADRFRAAQAAREALSRSPYPGDPEARQDAIELERRGRSE